MSGRSFWKWLMSNIFGGKPQLPCEKGFGQDLVKKAEGIVESTSDSATALGRSNDSVRQRMIRMEARVLGRK